ncbi:DUF4305 domain-containing protein [Bacillus sp. HMF5848]|uniref:DUF4305 domain-containing protein n=1 Tax=Bacillus sp. HMF5848 TaxID=2495421 RepID=UPI000F77E5EB|nr:DUF4305 domain-containing protein [Bacillus sp. HMF5848]RSK25678.1 DUF4305 domain-containing protein [Bacillus sp. HMF5848]
MKISINVGGMLYLILGILFLLLAIQSAKTGGMWTFSTVFLMVFAALDIGTALRSFMLQRKLLKKKTKNGEGY